MQPQKRIKSILSITRYAVLLLWLTAIGIAGCQQPTKPLAKEIKTGKSLQRPVSSPSKPNKPNNGNGGNTTNPQNGNGQNNDQGTITYQGLDIPETLARSPQRLREIILPGQQLSETEPEFNDQGRLVKYIEKEVEYDISAAFEDSLLLDPAQNSIYPGAVLQGDSLDQETYHEITEGNKRNAVISFDLQGVKNKDGKPGITSGNIVPNLASYRELHNQILSQNITYNASANLSYEDIEITNEKSLEAQLKMGVGFGAAGIKSKIAAGFKFKKNEHKERRLIKFVETFYTVDVNQEAAPLMINIPRKSVGDRMPVYVSSVSYGRIAYLTIESNQEKSELKANLEAVVKATTTNNGEIDIDAAIQRLEKGTNITINIIGGGSEAVINLKQFQTYIVKEGFSSKNPGRIIKYQLRFLDDNASAYIKYDEKYKAVERIEIPANGYKVTAVVTNIKCSGFYSTDVSGTIDMQPPGKNMLRKTIFNYSHTGMPQKLTVRNGKDAKPQLQPADIIAANASSPVELAFNIQGDNSGTPVPFVSSNQGDNPLQLSRTVSELQRNPFQSFKLYRKGKPTETLLFDVRFKIEKEV